MRRWAGDEKAEEVKETWDAVVVATAFYDYLVFPETPGIAQLRELGLAQHAQSWRGPDGYEGKVRYVALPLLVRLLKVYLL
jgi:cation diffusion facilitator CzcD-associated flavoprotein CzcO